MQSLTVQELVPEKKQCLICGRIFSRPKCTSWQNWALRKTCSLKCRLIRTRNQPPTGKALRYNIRTYNCCLCDTNIMGTKKTLLEHKRNFHSYWMAMRYYDFYKRCTICEVWLDKTLIRCPHCGNMLRTKPHNTFNRHRVVARQNNVWDSTLLR